MEQSVATISDQRVYYFVYNNNISVYYFSIMVTEKGHVTEKGRIQIFRLI